MRLGELSDLEQAISRFTGAAQWIPNGHPNKPAMPSDQPWLWPLHSFCTPRRAGRPRISDRRTLLTSYLRVTPPTWSSGQPRRPLHGLFSSGEHQFKGLKRVLSFFLSTDSLWFACEHGSGKVDVYSTFGSLNDFTVVGGNLRLGWCAGTRARDSAALWSYRACVSKHPSAERGTPSPWGEKTVQHTLSSFVVPVRVEGCVARRSPRSTVIKRRSRTL
ncbi:hypothetical protein L210DRAFT_2230531 [Boletus edulis BED1]|uniref:Uncharacterized protein n=1 Tax=Boletus edulis BED1 TaxID=1328754 RepID=A0AAD4BS52_BOLED|nr:hypothetical protein L210DRAFT_2230531 [Boletus edulis BED1]